MVKASSFSDPERLPYPTGGAAYHRTAGFQSLL
jgi:hypothetical protein